MTSAGLKILLVEDDPHDAELIEHALESHTIVRATSAQEALVAAAANGFDVAIFDLRLPDIDIRDDIRILSLVPKPVVVLSGHITAELQLDLLEAGAQECLEKAVGFTGLGIAISRAIARQSHLDNVLEGRLADDVWDERTTPDVLYKAAQSISAKARRTTASIAAFAAEAIG